MTPSKLLETVLAYLGLFRADAAVIAFFSFLLGAELAGGATWASLASALLVTGFSANFCYVYNAWTDRENDRVNKPGRPIPSGRVTPARARNYAWFLFAGSLAYPFLVAASSEALALYLAIPLLGWAYSSPWPRLKNHPPFSILIVSMGLTIPMVLGHIHIRGAGSKGWFFFLLFWFASVVVPLKDMGDEAGDLSVGECNLYHRFGSRLVVFSLAGLFAGLAASPFVPAPWMLRAGAGCLFGAGLCLVGAYYLAGVPRRPYRAAILLVDFLAVSGWVAAFAVNRGLVPAPARLWIQKGLGLG
ncbi:MAG: UbiA family prenyltransferase [Deltaproteobacteria bacterium]|nr:UbiA family prenyltransferase [Deltaproteobacteria bacterium]